MIHGAAAWRELVGELALWGDIPLDDACYWENDAFVRGPSGAGSIVVAAKAPTPDGLHGRDFTFEYVDARHGSTGTIGWPVSVMVDFCALCTDNAPPVVVIPLSASTRRGFFQNDTSYPRDRKRALSLTFRSTGTPSIFYNGAPKAFVRSNTYDLSAPWNNSIVLCTNVSGTYDKIYCIRIYSRALTAEEIAANYAVDAERFNLDGGGYKCVVMFAVALRPRSSRSLRPLRRARRARPWKEAA